MISSKVAKAKTAYVTDTHIVVYLEDGRIVQVPLEWYPRLLHATPEERRRVEVYEEVLRWPDLDEDISVEGLLAGRRSGESRRSFKRWLAARTRKG